jgi:heme/copper-type cytochrome/quinol oxidase subunit 2
MFSQGQLVFAALFVIAFVIASIFVYRKDKNLHRVHYKGVTKILLGFIAFIILLFIIKSFLKH